MIGRVSSPDHKLAQFEVTGPCPRASRDFPERAKACPFVVWVDTGRPLPSSSCGGRAFSVLADSADEFLALTAVPGDDVRGRDRWVCEHEGRFIE